MCPYFVAHKGAQLNTERSSDNYTAAVTHLHMSVHNICSVRKKKRFSLNYSRQRY